jgi:hypothetical protein
MQSSRLSADDSRRHSAISEIKRNMNSFSVAPGHLPAVWGRSFSHGHRDSERNEKRTSSLRKRSFPFLNLDWRSSLIRTPSVQADCINHVARTPKCRIVYAFPLIFVLVLFLRSGSISSFPRSFGMMLPAGLAIQADCDSQCQACGVGRSQRFRMRDGTGARRKPYP